MLRHTLPLAADTHNLFIPLVVMGALGVWATCAFMILMWQLLRKYLAGLDEESRQTEGATLVDPSTLRQARRRVSPS